LYRDPPPSAVNAVIFTHRDRLWWFTDLVNYSGVYQNYCTQLWYSDYGVPTSYDPVDQAILVGADSLESIESGGNILTNGYVASYGNYPMGGLSVSGVAILLKKYGAFILDGVDEATFFVSPLLGASGCIARKSIAKSVQAAYWLSERGPEKYELGTGCVYIGEPIRGILDKYSPNDKAAAVGWYSRQSYWLSFPTQNTTFVYRVEAQKWWGPLPYGTTYVSSLPSDTSPGPLGQTGSVLAVRPGTTTLDAWQAAETDLTTPISAVWDSPQTDCGTPWIRKSFRYVTVGAPVQPGVIATVVLSIWDINAAAPQAITFTFDLSLAPYQTQSIAENGTHGYYIQAQVTLYNASNPTTFATLWSVVVGGTPLEAFLMGQ
jgi:hypothetical protein